MEFEGQNHMNAKTRFLVYAVVLASCLAACWYYISRAVIRNPDQEISKEELTLNLTEALDRIDNFRGTVAITSTADGQVTTHIVYEVVSKGTDLLYVSGKNNGEPSLAFVDKGDRGWILPEPGGELETTLIDSTSHPSMQSYMAGLLSALNDRDFVSSVERIASDRFQVLVKAADMDAEWRYELDSRTFVILKQHSHGPHGTGVVTWTAIDMETEVPEAFFDEKLEDLRKMAAGAESNLSKRATSGVE